MGKPVLSLQPSEGIVVQAAAAIYAAYITTGRAKEGSEKEWMKRSIDEALWMAMTTDEMIQSDNELG